MTRSSTTRSAWAFGSPGDGGSRRPWRAVAALAALLLAGCVAAYVRSAYEGTGFTHDLHLKRDLACADCHEGAEKATRAGMPKPEKCADCHDGSDPKDAGLPGAQAYAARAEAARYASPRAFADVRFDHGKHAAAKLACARCHDGAAAGPVASPAGPPRMDACLECHREGVGGRKGPLDCRTCHVKLSTSTPPASHDGPWTRRHGSVARFASGDRVEERCDVCHTRASCAQCHQATRPADHTNNFVVAGHGLRAAMDRDRCLSCHRTDSCERCHQNRAPRSHVAGFGETGLRHCTSCHFPLGDQGCIACHKATPSHLRAPPRPAGGVHATAVSPGECLQCHTRLAHPDGGFDCKICHR